MNLAVVHYHLNRGGVTQVIINQLRALESVLRAGQHRDAASLPTRIALLYGGRAQGWPDRLPEELSSIELHLHEVPGLDYDEEAKSEPQALARAIAAALEELHFVRDETVLHVHNHALGKNAALPGALVELGHRGYRLVLQIHDFIEDFRPHLYHRLRELLPTRDELTFTGELYPQAAHVHYAFLNRRHQAVAQKAGFSSSRLHLLPNPVIPPLGTSAKQRSRADRLVVYPVRGIRRKNLGEMLLWASLGSGTEFATTLAPLNPAERPAYDRWKRLSSELHLPCLFEIGEGGSLAYPDVIAEADALLTTSLAEGFGMVFLEAWMFSRMLFGRDLPEVTADFVEAGLDLDSLALRLAVPLAWVGRETFIDIFADSFRNLLRAYGEQVPATSDVRDTIERMLIFDECIDFGTLPACAQELLLQRIQTSSADREELLRLNPVMARSLHEGNSHDAVIATNAAAVRRNYGPHVSGRRLLELYRIVLESDVATEMTPPSHGDLLMKQFLDVERFRPLLLPQ